MPIIVNGVELEDADIERELPAHADSAHALRDATLALVLRRVLLDEAARLGLPTDSDEAAIEALMAREVELPEVDEASCRRYYDAHRARFTVGELVEAEHILFQVTPRVDLEQLRARAEMVLAGLLADPSRFAERAHALSNCPSGQLGGQLGQIGRGDTLPEFEKVLFAMEPGAILHNLVETRYGLHIVRVARRVEGRLQPFERVRQEIATALRAASQDRAWQQYLRVLVGRARISGVELPGAESPLLQ